MTLKQKELVSAAVLIAGLLLMLIGGSPGSTAGGMKNTTFAVLFATAIAVFRRRPNAHIFGRRIPNDTAHYAATVLILYTVLFLAGGIFISYQEGMPIMPALFEAASAIGTVGAVSYTHLTLPTILLV